MEPVIITLDGERDASPLVDTQELIHPREFSQALDFIAESYKTAGDYNPANLNDELKRKHNTITVSGPRGSGKTTFLLSLLNKIKEGKSIPFNGKDYEFKQDIQVLKLIDPTLIEEKDHLFVNIISLIVNLVQERADKLNCYSDPKNEHFTVFQDWEASFKKLADGMPSIDGLSSKASNEWLDSEFIMEQGIRQTTAANNLELNFHFFISKSLGFIGKKAFLIGFDDIDTSFTRGWPVLEILRKYLTTPQIITILSGDLELYSALIRKRQWDNFDINILTAEKEFTESKYFNLINHLEEQYLLKILKPERRLHLKTIYVNQLLGQNYKIKFKENEVNVAFEMKDFYFRIGFPKLNINSTIHKDLYYSFITNLPFRFQKQLAFAFQSERSITDSVFEIFWSNWNQLNTDPSSIRDQQDFAVLLLLKFLVNNNLLKDGFSFRPDNTDKIINGALFNAGVYLKFLFKHNSYFIFDYFIRIGLTRELSTIFDDKVVTSPYSLVDYINQCELLTEKNGRQNARMIASYIRGYSLVSRTKDLVFYSKFGTLSLPALYETTKRKREGQLDRIISSKENSIIQILGYLPASNATHHKGYNTPMYSIFNLFGIIEEILFNTRTLKNDTKKTQEAIVEALIRNSQLRSYNIPNWVSSRAPAFDAINTSFKEAYSKSELSDGSSTSIQNIDENVQKLVGDIIDWCKILDNCNMPMPYLLSKISTRFFYNLNSIDFNSNKIPNLGEWFHRIIIAFLNAVLVEDVIENKTDVYNDYLKIILINPLLSDQIFLNNLKSFAAISQSHQKSNFFSTIKSCPLLLVYLNPDSDSYKELTSGSLLGKANKNFDFNIYKVLKELEFDLNIYFSYINRAHRGQLKRYLSENNYSAQKITEMSSQDFVNKVLIPAFPDDVNAIHDRSFDTLKKKIEMLQFKW